MAKSIETKRAVGGLARFLNDRRDRLAEWAQKRIDPSALIRFALMDYQKSPQLQNCSPESIYLALIACAQLGLEPGGVKGEAYIVPYKGTATFQLGYRGILTLAHRSPLIRKLSSNVVHDRDQFEIDIGTNSRIVHRPALDDDRGEVLGAYAYAVLPHDEIDVEWMSRADLEKIKASAQGTGRSDSPWRLWEDQMFRKSPIRRLGKRLPLDADAAFALQLDGAAIAGDRDAYRDAFRGRNIEPDVIDVPASASGVDRVKSKMRSKPDASEWGASAEPEPEPESEAAPA